MNSDSILSARPAATPFAAEPGAGALSEARALSSSLSRDASAGEVERAAAKFEELFATMLVKELRRALPEGFFGSGAGADVYGGWLDEHLGAALAKDGGLGFAGMIKASLQPRAGAALEGGLER